MIEYEDFSLKIEPKRGDAYPVIVLRSPAGEGRSSFHLPFDLAKVGDGSGPAFSTNTSQFLALASNGVGFYTGFGSCTFFSGSNWTCSSDRNLKENFIALAPQEILAALVQIPITRWNMKGQDPSIYHVGPTAQDFYAAFGLGEDDEHINTGDEIGIAFAAIQGLHQVNQEQADQIAELQAQNADLEARLTALEQAVGGRRIPRKPGCSSAGCWWPSSCGSAISLKGEK